jgi:oligopeptide transport system substrate-binding protein
MKRIMSCLLMGLLIFFLASCTDKSAQVKIDFGIANGAEPETLDPHLMSGVPEHRIYEAIFEGLLIYDPKTAEGIPGIAESWEVTEEGTVYTFHLRKSSWSDGVAVTAQTFVDSWIRMLDPVTAAPYSWFPAMFIKGAAEFNSGDAGPDAVKIKALDDYTFRIELIGPLPYVEGALPHYAFSPVPLHAIEKYDAAWTNPENIVVNGPFTLTEWVPQDKLIVEKNDTYWDADAVALDRIIFIPNDSINTTYNMYLNEEVDWTTAVPIERFKEARLRDDLHVSPQLASYYYVIQNDVEVLNDPKVRKALGMAINRSELVEKVTGRGELPSSGITPTMSGYDAVEGNNYNPEKAREFLVEAGFPGGEGFPDFTIIYNTNDDHKKIAEYIQANWLDILGINVSLENLEWKTFLPKRRAGDFQIARGGWIGDYQDPNTFLELFLSTSAMNGGNYNNKRYDDLLAKAARLPAGNERLAILREAEELFIVEEQGIIPIYTYVNINMFNNVKWGGWYQNVMDYHPWKNIYLKQE